MLTYLLPILSLHAHVQLVLVFLPWLWREIDVRGVRWHHLLVLLVMPAFFIFLIVSQLATSGGSTPTWHFVVGFLAIDGYLLSMGLAALSLRQRRARAA